MTESVPEPPPARLPPQGHSPGTQQPHPNALEAAQALVTHSAPRLEGPEARDVVAQVVQLQLSGDEGSERNQASPTPAPATTKRGGLHPSLPLPQRGQECGFVGRGSWRACPPLEMTKAALRGAEGGHRLWCCFICGLPVRAKSFQSYPTLRPHGL